MEFFFDNQYRRYLLQFMRIFADLKIEVSPGVLRRVPIRYGDMSRMVAHILRENSQNTTMTAPQMSAWIQSIELAPERRNDTSYVRKTRAVEREFDADTGQYTSRAGNRYSIESYMPVPYTLNVQLDIWTTNTTDKFQIIEQISTVFNPTVQLQTTDNVLDWTSIFEVELTSINWSSRGVPVGADSANDFASMNFKVPVWISPPARVTKQKIVEQIVINLFDGHVDAEEIKGALDPLHSCFDKLKQYVVTPGNHRIEVVPGDGDELWVHLLDAAGEREDGLSWSGLFATYGNLDLASALLTLKTDDDIESQSGDVVGSVVTDPNVPDRLLFAVDQDTLPPTIPAVDAIIDPIRHQPGNGLPAAAPGQRYLLVDTSNRTAGEEPITPIGATLSPWGSVVAWEGDIIQYNGTEWVVVFDARNTSTVQHVENIDDGQHYRFKDGEWVYTFLGTYNPGYWRVEV